MATFDEQHFEDEVRRIGRALWPDARHGGAELIDQEERDGIFVTEEIVHVVECTTSTKKLKAEEDAASIAKVCKEKRKEYSDKIVRGWFITLREPEAHQREVVLATGKKHQVSIACISFDTFRNKLIDAPAYLECRDKYKFGSIRNPADGSLNVSRDEYIALEILQADMPGKIWSADGIRAAMCEGKRFVILGDYGAGKSMTLRDIFFRLEISYRQKTHLRFPIYLNLADHQGQRDPVEALRPVFVPSCLDQQRQAIRQ